MSYDIYLNDQVTGYTIEFDGLLAFARMRPDGVWDGD